MTGYDIYKRVCSLLGYKDFGNENDKGAVFHEMLNQIASDLKLDETKSLSDEIPLTTPQKEAVIYGSAMLLAVSIGDSNCAKLYSELYNCKRSSALSSSDLRVDVLPTPQSGGI
ncbi:MAG: hypothetical protein IJO62_04375 [Clostridia bacterium]|nr:hypothetical protein [Clostridia bacterium]